MPRPQNYLDAQSEMRRRMYRDSVGSPNFKQFPGQPIKRRSPRGRFGVSEPGSGWGGPGPLERRFRHKTHYFNGTASADLPLGGSNRFHGRYHYDYPFTEVIADQLSSGVQMPNSLPPAPMPGMEGLQPMDPGYKDPALPEQAPIPESDQLGPMPNRFYKMPPGEYEAHRNEVNQGIKSTARQRLADRNMRNLQRVGVGGGSLPMDAETQRIFDQAVGPARRGRRRYGAEISDPENDNRFGGYPTGPVEPEVPAGPVTTRGLPSLADRFAHLGGGSNRVTMDDGSVYNAPGSQPVEGMNPATHGKYNPSRFYDPATKGVIDQLPGGSIPFRTKSGGIGLRGVETTLDDQGNPVEGSYGRKGPLKAKYDAQVARHLAKKMGIRGKQAIQSGESPEQAIGRLSEMLQNGKYTKPMADRMERRRRYFGVGSIGPAESQGGTGVSFDHVANAKTQEDADKLVDSIFSSTYDDVPAMVENFKKSGVSSVMIQGRYEQAIKNIRNDRPGTPAYERKKITIDKWREAYRMMTGRELPEYDPSTNNYSPAPAAPPTSPGSGGYEEDGIGDFGAQ